PDEGQRHEDGTILQRELRHQHRLGAILAISRDFRVTKGVKATFRAEATNLFNMVSLGQPGTSVPAAGTTSATFGVIRTANPMRRLQLGARLTFSLRASVIGECVVRIAIQP